MDIVAYMKDLTLNYDNQKAKSQMDLWGPRQTNGNIDKDINVDLPNKFWYSFWLNFIYNYDVDFPYQYTSKNSVWYFYKTDRCIAFDFNNNLVYKLKNAYQKEGYDAAVCIYNSIKYADCPVEYKELDNWSVSVVKKPYGIGNDIRCFRHDKEIIEKAVLLYIQYVEAMCKCLSDDKFVTPTTLSLFDIEVFDNKLYLSNIVKRLDSNKEDYLTEQIKIIKKYFKIIDRDHSDITKRLECLI